MARPSSKKVTRAARTSGGRTARGATPWGWYMAMAIVVALGTVGVYTSREQRLDKANAGGGDSPKVGEHWHAALGVYECDHFTENVKDNGRDPLGIHTHNDGIMHIHPFVKSAAGKNATIKIFADTVGMKVNVTSFKLPGEEKTFRDGQKCKGKTGEVTLWVNGKQRTGNPATYKPNDRDLIVLAFTAKGEKPPTVPPSAPNLDKLSDVPGATSSTVPGSTESTVPGAPGSTVPGSPTTTAPGSPTTTAPASPTTAAP
jgi:hypothetical protein